MDRVADIISGITLVALVTTVVSHRRTAAVISATGNTYAGALRAAMGN